MTIATPDHSRWASLDVLRGLSVIGMLLTLNPRAWEQEYNWLTHVKWQGGHLIDMVAPAFLFCVGAAIPLSMRRRFSQGTGKPRLIAHILGRSIAIILVGLTLNAYPQFDLAHTRIPGVLQRIGLSFGAVSLFLLLISETDNDQNLTFRIRPITAMAIFILVSYWLPLYAVPVGLPPATIRSRCATPVNWRCAPYASSPGLVRFQPWVISSCCFRFCGSFTTGAGS